MHYELMLAARKALAAEFENQYSIAYENITFTPPANGGIWLKFDYIEADTKFLSLDRKCVSYIGMVQVSVVLAPGSGADRSRQLANAIAKFFEDGKMLETGYVSEGGAVKPIQKSESGWLIPVRFTVRTEEKR